MQLTTFSIKNFKCLLDIDISLAQKSPVTFLIGLNGSGKSTVLQAFDFVGEMMRGEIKGWLEKRGWKSSDLPTKIHSSRRKSLVDISIAAIDKEYNFSWQASFNPNPNFLRCTSEKLIIYSSTLNQTIEAQVRDGRFIINKDEQEINFTYFGSIFSQLNDKILSEYNLIKNIRDFIANIHSFDLLSPRNIRNRSRKNNTIGMSGENLAGYIASLDVNQQEKLTEKLKYFYPWISCSEVKGYQFGWKELFIGENIGQYPDFNNDYHNYYILRRSQHINDGTLRLLSIIAEVLFHNGITLFDEIENGFNPHIVNKLVDMLYTSPSQLIVTTHSPEVLQYIPEGQERDSVKLMYRKNDATSDIVDFFSLPEASERLKILSPGETYLDVDLKHISETLGTQTKE